MRSPLVRRKKYLEGLEHHYQAGKSSGYYHGLTAAITVVETLDPGTLNNPELIRHIVAILQLQREHYPFGVALASHRRDLHA